MKPQERPQVYSSAIFATATLTGMIAGLALAQITPTSPVPVKQPQWRERAAVLRSETEALYARLPQGDPWASRPYALSALHAAYDRIEYQPEWDPPVPVYPPESQPEAIPQAPATTGNEAMIAELNALNDRLGGTPDSAHPDAEREIPIDDDG